MLNWLKQKVEAAAASKEAQRQEDQRQRALAAAQDEQRRKLIDRIERRFPPSALFRVPDAYARIVEDQSELDDPADRRRVILRANPDLALRPMATLVRIALRGSRPESVACREAGRVTRYA